MAAGRINGHRRRIREELRTAFTEDHTPRETAGSFALGAFITMLPTLGTGLVLFVVLAYVFDWISELSLLASVLVFNPVVKWGVYVSSFVLGVFLLGPVEGVSVADASLGAGPAVVARLLVGNFLLAALAAVVCYALVYRLAVRFEGTEIGETVDEAVDEIVDEALDP